MLERYQATSVLLASRSIAPIAEIGEDPETGAPYTVTDFEAHPTLADLVELCPLSTSEMVRLMQNLGRAVDLLHGSGILHLALHPNNVFVGPAPEYEARIVDFGSGAVRGALRSREKLDQKAPWLAPEQMQEGAAVDGRADVFAAALVAIFAASGRSYWRSCEKGAVDVAAWQRELVAPRTPASQRARELSLELPPALDAVFARALAASPKDRFRTVGEFAAALASADGSGARARSTTSGDAAFAAPVALDIPPPPAQIEAVLNAFEGNGSTAHRETGAPLAGAVAEAAPLAETSDPFAEEEQTVRADESSMPWADDRAAGPARARVVYLFASAALLVGIGGAYAMFSSGKPSPPPGAEPAASASKVVVSSPPVEEPRVPVSARVPASAPVPSAIAPEPPPSEAPAPESQPAQAAPAPTRPPVWRRPPAAPRPAVKKPCGKFLKRCN
jgi:hypothetical protein